MQEQNDNEKREYSGPLEKMAAQLGKEIRAYLSQKNKYLPQGSVKRLQSYIQELQEVISGLNKENVTTPEVYQSLEEKFIKVVGALTSYFILLKRARQKDEDRANQEEYAINKAINYLSKQWNASTEYTEAQFLKNLKNILLKQSPEIYFSVAVYHLIFDAIIFYDEQKALDKKKAAGAFLEKLTSTGVHESPEKIYEEAKELMPNPKKLSLLTLYYKNYQDAVGKLSPVYAEEKTVSQKAPTEKSGGRLKHNLELLSEKLAKKVKKRKKKPVKLENAESVVSQKEEKKSDEFDREAMWKQFGIHAAPKSKEEADAEFEKDEAQWKSKLSIELRKKELPLEIQRLEKRIEAQEKIIASAEKLLVQVGSEFLRRLKLVEDKSTAAEKELGAAEKENDDLKKGILALESEKDRLQKMFDALKPEAAKPQKLEPDVKNPRLDKFYAQYKAADEKSIDGKMSKAEIVLLAAQPTGFWSWLINLWDYMNPNNKAKQQREASVLHYFSMQEALEASLETEKEYGKKLPEKIQADEAELAKRKQLKKDSDVKVQQLQAKVSSGAQALEAAENELVQEVLPREAEIKELNAQLNGLRMEKAELEEALGLLMGSSQEKGPDHNGPSGLSLSHLNKA